MSTILNNIPAEAQITRIEYEGPRIALYTKNPNYLQKNNYIISEIVNSLKKRVVTRTEKSIRKPEDEARAILDRLFPQEAAVASYFFDDALGEVTAEVGNPKVLSQEGGFDLGNAMEQTGWKIKVRKAPHLTSTAIQNVNFALKSGNAVRELFLRDLGESIFRPRLTSSEQVTIKTLGAFQEVGRSCLLMETSESKVLLDCGIHPGARNNWDAYPRLDWADVGLDEIDAAHILGSSTVHLHIGEGAHNVVYSGDYKYGRTLLLDSATWNYPRVETLITESTYGAKEDIMPLREEVEMNFVNAINGTLKEGGKVLIPIPAVGRAQEILLVIDRYMKNKSLVETPVFIEGMISEATAIHVSYADYLSRELRTMMLDEGTNPFLSEYFTAIEHPSNREEALREGPAIIMATSGMLEGGPVLEYFGSIAPNEKNKMLFVSYQVQGTLGRRVLDGSSQASLMGENGKIKIVDVRCKVQRVEGFSGHSDYNQIIRFIGKLRPKIQQVIVNHGEKRKVENLAYAIQRIYRVPAIHPAVQEAIRLY